MTTVPQRSPKFNRQVTIAVAAFSALLVMLPYHAIGTGESALTVQSLEHWMSGQYDVFAVSHVQWLWMPRVFAFITGDAASALTLFRALSLFAALAFFGRWTARSRTPATAMWSVAMLAGNILVLHSERTYDLVPIALLTGMISLTLLSSERASFRDLGALMLGLMASVSISAVVGVLMIVAVAMGNEEGSIPLDSIRTWLFIFAGFFSWFLLGSYYFGVAALFDSVTKLDPIVATGSSFLHLITIFLVAINVLLVFCFRKFKKPAERMLVTALIVGSFLFCFRDRLDWHMVLTFGLIGLIPYVLERSKRPWLLAAITIVANLLLFFGLPSVTNEYQYGLAADRRTKTLDDINLDHEFNRGFVGFNSIANARAIEREVNSVLTVAPKDSAVIILSHSTDGYFDGGTLGALYPNRSFAMIAGRPLTAYRVNGLATFSFLKQIFASHTLIGIFDKRLAREFIDNALPYNSSIRETEHLQAITLTTVEGQHALIDRLIYLYYISVGH